MPKAYIYLAKSASVLVSLEIIFGMDKFGMSESNPENEVSSPLNGFIIQFYRREKGKLCSLPV